MLITFKGFVQPALQGESLQLINTEMRVGGCFVETLGTVAAWKVYLTSEFCRITEVLRTLFVP